MLSGLKWIVISVVKIKTCVVGLHSYFFKYATCVILCLINIQDKLILLYQQCLPISKCTSSSRLSASSRYWTQWSSRREPSTKRCSVPKSWSWHLQRKNSTFVSKCFVFSKSTITDLYVSIKISKSEQNFIYLIWNPHLHSYYYHIWSLCIKKNKTLINIM